MANRSKAKGNSFERDICVDLSNFFGMSFQRVPNSGAMVGGKNFHRLKTMSDSQVLLTRGDIIVPDELCNLCIECKSRKGFGFHQLLHPDGSKTLNDWIEQTMVGVINSTVAIWLVIFKPNNCGKFVVFEKNSGLIQSECYVNYKYNGTEFLIVSFDETFLKLNKEILLEKCAKKTPITTV